jgi:DNA-binding MurR/RpiR family transcriptional regulator
VAALNEFAHETFVTPVESPAFGDSYVAPMALMNVIVVGCANYRRKRTLALMKEVEQEQKHGFRWYEAQ